MRTTTGGRRDLEVGNTQVLAEMIMNTFADRYDFAGRTVYPFVTYAVSGLGGTERDYTASCAGAQISPGLAVQGEEVSQHRENVETWLRQNRLLN